MYKNNYLKVAAATPIVKIGDPVWNAENILKLAEMIPAKIILFPELCITGYSVGDWLLNKELLHQHEIALKKIVDESGDKVLIVGSIFEFHYSLYNVAYVIQNKKILGICPKTYLPKSREFSEPRYFAAGNLSEDVYEVELYGQKIPFGKMLFKSTDLNVAFGIEICADVWTNDSPSDDLYVSGAEIVFNLSASTFTVGKYRQRLMLCENASFKGQGAYIYSSNGITETSSDLCFTGHQIAYNCGNLLLNKEVISFENEYSTVDIDLEYIKFKRLSSGRLHDYKVKKNLEVPFELSESPEYHLEILPTKYPFYLDGKDRADVAAVTTAALYKRLSHIGITRSIIGVSGGLDSTLALMFLYDCYTKYGLDLKDIIGITMPGLATSGKTKSLAERLMEKLGVTKIVTPIKEQVVNHLQLIGHDGVTKDVTYENAQARYRTYVLMNNANIHNGLVIGTSDMSEIALGWSTFAGDQIAMYALNSGLPKTAVRCMVNYYKEKYPFVKEELEEILNLPISPELTGTDQLTEDIIGSYEINDFILFSIFNDGLSKSRVVFLLEKVFNLSNKDATFYYDRFMRRFKQNQFKRLASCEGVKIFDLSLSARGDFKFPGDMK